MKKQMRRFKIISFDLDGTLVDKRFDDEMWFKEVPKLYAAKHGVSFKQAYRECRAAYDAVGNYRLNWYRICYWLNRFGIRRSRKLIMRDLRRFAKPYSDAAPVLRSLKRKGFRVVVVSNAAPCFLEFKLDAAGLSRYVSERFSVSGRFGTVRKSKRVYARLCRVLRAKPREIVHVGDFRDFDFDQPRAAGITAFLLNRGRKHKPRSAAEKFFFVRNLKEFEKKLSLL